MPEFADTALSSVTVARYGSFLRLVSADSCCVICISYFDSGPKEARKPGPVTEYSDDDMRRYVVKVVVYPEKMEVVFKDGVVIPIHR